MFVVEEVDISENFISGSKYKPKDGVAQKDYNSGVDYDTNVTGIEALELAARAPARR